MKNSTLSTNSAFYGGGLSNGYETANLVNSTLVYNVGYGDAAAVYNDDNGTVQLFNVTVALNNNYNSVGYSGGLYRVTGTIRLRNSIVALNAPHDTRERQFLFCPVRLECARRIGSDGENDRVAFHEFVIVLAQLRQMLAAVRSGKAAQKGQHDILFAAKLRQPHHLAAGVRQHKIRSHFPPVHSQYPTSPRACVA